MVAIVNEDIIAIAIAELSQKNIGYTGQFLEIHQVEVQDSNPVIKHVRLHDDYRTATVYFKVKGEDFFFAISVDLEERQVRWSYSEDYVQISFFVESTKLSCNDLCKLTQLKPDWVCNIGDEFGLSKQKADTNRIVFQPCKEPDNLANKLQNLLIYLDTDKNGITNLIANAMDAYILVTCDVHNFNSHIGGVNLDANTLKRLAALNVSIDFDFFAVGELGL